MAYTTSLSGINNFISKLNPGDLIHFKAHPYGIQHVYNCEILCIEKYGKIIQKLFVKDFSDKRRNIFFQQK
jgi:hypothetical protein